ncbi:MAG TPA: DNA polymerase III subunit delta [Candidatus Gemmiger avicola]|uniref:DNA-directed DNA polymerase n=1 Tax=Candidatus Gemmiger avicola TaxID=2838605 RepID=A0A9D2S2E9_9FIRM|nr:DNA polymerase III subunit delta [Candidatus Gemmiger avicola]
MLYSESELKKRLKAGCPVFYFYAGDEALVRSAAAKVEKALSADDPETTTLNGPTPSVEEIVLAAGTISFFGGKRLVLMPLVRPSAYSDKDLKEFCDTLADTENAVFVLTSVMEEKYGKLRPGKREQKLIAACEKIGYCVQIAKPNRGQLQNMARDWAGESGAAFAPGAEAMLLDRCGEDQFLLHSEIDKLAALANYGTITPEMIGQLGTVTLDADTFDMVKLVASGRTKQALEKLKTLLALQNDPILITGALISNYLDVYRAFLARKSRRPLGDMAKDFGYTGNWNYRLGNAEKTAQRFDHKRLIRSLEILQQLDLDLKGSRLPSDLLMQKALCELGLCGRRP